MLSGATAIARTGIGICVKKGAPHPDVSTPEALKAALLAAKTVGYTSPAGGGVTVAPILRVFERLGISEQDRGQSQTCGRRPEWPRQRAGVERRGRDRDCNRCPS